MKNSLLVFLSFLAVLSLVSCASTREIIEDYSTDTYIARMEYFNSHPLAGGEIVFLGNSITQAGKWEKYFPNAPVANRGISGDNTEGMLARVNTIVETHPSKIFIMAGINDISLSRTNKKILRNYKQIVEVIKQLSPNTEIFIQSVLPINNDFRVYKRLIGKEGQIKSLNKKLEQLAIEEKFNFINLYPFFLNSEAKLKEEFTGDGLHLSDDAYRLWSNIIRAKIEE